ncbi:hypothetical protein PU560_01505, partial [Georgenia sp. 10Sc9-8]|nr:hypothetical protein [Georgenia halotolerans]
MAALPWEPATSPESVFNARPSDRQRNTPNIGHVGFGIDTIRVWCHVQDDAFMQPVQRMKQLVDDEGEFSDLIRTTSTARVDDRVDLTIMRKDGRPACVAEF